MDTNFSEISSSDLLKNYPTVHNENLRKIKNAINDNHQELEKLTGRLGTIERIKGSILSVDQKVDTISNLVDLRKSVTATGQISAIDIQFTQIGNAGKLKLGMATVKPPISLPHGYTFAFTVLECAQPVSISIKEVTEHEITFFILAMNLQDLYTIGWHLIKQN